MKLLVFAHTPPPLHGQSHMVKLMLEIFGGDRRGAAAPAAASAYGITCYHVNARLSRNLEDIGGLRPSKIALLLKYCLEAIWCRVRYGVTTLYYVPAPGKRVALVRDWIVLLMCRPFYRRVVLHWHAAGLAKWLETVPRLRTRSITYRLFKDADLSIVLSKYNRADAAKLWPRQIQVVGNGIPDPCPMFDREVLPRRLARGAARRKLLAGERLSPDELIHSGNDPHVFHVLYLAHCTRQKGLFDAIAGVTIANQNLARRQAPVRLKLAVAGGFISEEERNEFERLLAAPDGRAEVTYLGFVTGARKHQALAEADLFCFPTFFSNENQPVNLIEALAYGLPVVSTRWRSVPDLLPPGQTGLVEPHAPAQIAQAILGLLEASDPVPLRRHFLQHYTLEAHLTGLSRALRSVG